MKTPKFPSTFSNRNVLRFSLLVVCSLVALPLMAAVASETSFVLNSFSFLLWGALVMWMCAGFLMLEAGSVRTKNASVICLKNIGLYAIAGLTYYAIGYNIMYVGVDGLGLWGDFTFFYGPSEVEKAFLDGDAQALEGVLDNGYAVNSDWFFQMVFVATTGSIISGALAERVKLYTFLTFIVILTAFIYPIVGAWTWGGGWLSQMGFQDFAGSTIVHSTGGWAALAGILIVGARTGKFRDDGTVKSTPPSNVPLVTLGIFILWLGWFGFNGGSVLALGDAASAVTMSIVLTNTNLAAGAGVITALALSRLVFGRVDLLGTLNGALGGLVAITAAPDITTIGWSVVIGAIGGLVCILGIKFLEKVKVDDVVGAVPAHLFAGIWGTLAACIAGGANFLVQLIGILAIGAFVFIVSGIVWFVLEKTLGVRVSVQTEQLGQDTSELGIESYPEFVINPDPDILEDFKTADDSG